MTASSTSRVSPTSAIPPGWRRGPGTHGGDDDIEVVAWLHDVVEDTDVTLQAIEEQFGSEIAQAVDAITRRPDDEGDEYYHRVADNPIALAVKRSDIEDNLDPRRTIKLDPATQRRLAAKYTHALAILNGESTT